MTTQDGPSPAKDPGALNISVTRVLPGNAWGVNAPTLLATIRFPTDEILSRAIDWSRVDDAIQTPSREPAVIKKVLDNFAAQSGNPESDHGDAFAIAFSARISAIIADAIAESGLPIFTHPRMISWSRGNGESFSIAIAVPYLPGHGPLSRNAVIIACRALVPLLGGAAPFHDQGAVRSKLIAHMSKAKLHGTNTLRFLEAAHDADVPLHYLSQAVCQYGWGANQLRGQSSILDTTRNLGVSIARDKFACASLLRQSGMPGALHILAPSLAQARKAANRIGYPIVVKPANLDGGVGVVSQIANEQQLDKAWNAAAKLTKSILVEKFCEGEDVRLIVIDGSLRWAVGRQRAGVVGNGKNTIAELVEEANLDARRGYHATASLRPLKIDDEAMDVLGSQRLKPDAIPAPGQFVALRTAANLSSGGTPRNVTELVHPETKAMVERAVGVLGLDIAGVDLITQDITRPWHETGATIIEINAQPQLIAASQNHLYGEILRSRLGPGDGRIPVALVFAKSGSSFVDALRTRLDKPDCAAIGLAIAPQAEIGGEAFGIKCNSGYRAGYALLMHKDVRGMILVAQDDELLKSGLPFDRCDLAVVTPDFLYDTAADTAREAFEMCTPHIAGPILTVNRNDAGNMPGWFAADEAETVADDNALIERLVNLMCVESAASGATPPPAGAKRKPEAGAAL